MNINYNTLFTLSKNLLLIITMEVRCLFMVRVLEMATERLTRGEAAGRGPRGAPFVCRS